LKHGGERVAVEPVTPSRSARSIIRRGPRAPSSTSAVLRQGDLLDGDVAPGGHRHQDPAGG
jgi:hypothetical protein